MVGKRPQIYDEDLRQAIAEYFANKHKVTILSIANCYNIPRTTLSDRIKAEKLVRTINIGYSFLVDMIKSLLLS